MTVSHAPIPDGSLATPALWNNRFNAIWKSDTFNVEAYKADGLDDDAALLAAARAAHDAGGGIVVLPGHYTITQTLDLSDFDNVLFTGVTGGIASSAGSSITYSGTDSGPAIKLASVNAVGFRDVSFRTEQTSGYMIETGWSAAASDPAYITFERCRFSGGTAVTLVHLSKVIISGFRDCNFVGGDYAIMRNNYANVITIDNCAFHQQELASIRSPGECWNIRGCTFEPNNDGSVRAVSYDTAIGYARAVLYEGNWHGDGNNGGTVFQIKTLGGKISGNYFFTGDIGVELISGCQGVEITGNRFNTNTGINLTGFIFGGLIAGNDFQCTTSIGTIDNFIGTVIGNNNQGDLIKAHFASRTLVTGSKSEATSSVLGQVIDILATLGILRDGTTS